MRSPVYYMGLVMGVIYILTGIFSLMWTMQGKVQNYPTWVPLTLGILLIVYGVFRIYRFFNSNAQ